MRRRTVVAAAALIAAVALAVQPAPAGSQTPSSLRGTAQAALTSVVIKADALTPQAAGAPDPALVSAGAVDPATSFAEPGRRPRTPKARPRVDQPVPAPGEAYKDPKYKVSGYATFYYAGSTAMRLPRGTVIVVCGAGGCIERTVTDYGPMTKSRVIDLYAPDFFQICGCASWSGSTWVTVSVY